MISDEFRRFQETMNRMFEELWGVPAPGRLLLPSGERAIEKYESIEYMPQLKWRVNRVIIIFGLMETPWLE